MTKNKENNQEREEINLFRGGSVVSSFTGSFGGSLRETRLTAILGYLIALEPNLFIEKFHFKGKPTSVSLETFHGKDRSDILIKTTEGVGVVEAKINNIDPFKQSLKYPANWRVLLTQNAPFKRKKKNVIYITWKDVGEIVSKLAKSSNQKTKFVSMDLLTYMEEHNMIKRKESVEVYAREINEEKTLNIFLKASLYGCWYEKGSRLPEALYFAPHFGKKIANEYHGVRVGINYIAKIETVEVVDTWNNLLETCLSIRGKNWLNKHQYLLDPIHKQWEWGSDKNRSFLFLHTPRLVFNPPVKKENLQEGSGWLSKRFLSFDELYSAWGT